MQVLTNIRPIIKRSLRAVDSYYKSHKQDKKVRRTIVKVGTNIKKVK